jgi:hypothetical protein
MANLYDPRIPAKFFDVKDGVSDESLRPAVDTTKQLMDFPKAGSTLKH